MISITLIYIYHIYIVTISRRILTVKAAGHNTHSDSHWKRLSRRPAQEVGVPQLSCYTSFGLLNISITFSHAHLVLLCYIFRFSNGTSKCRGCLNKVNSFCYVCGDFITVAQRWTITSLLKTAYFHYFDCKIGDQDTSWAPHICCKPCYNGLTAGSNGKKAAFNFAVLMVWREPRNHADDCYFCLTNITGFNASSRKKIKYPNLRSAMRPVPHSDDFPVSTPPINKDLLSSSDEEMPSREDSTESISLERYWVYIFRTKWQWATLDHARRPEWSCSWFVSVKTDSQSSWLLGLNSGTSSRKM